MLTDETIVGALRANRLQFGDLFLRAQAHAGRGAHERFEFEAVALGRPDAAAFGAAIAFARTKHFLDPLVDLIVAADADDGSLKAALLEDRAKRDAPLQAMTDAARGFMQPDVAARGIVNGLRWTGKILIDTDAKGTGILIGPNLVLTAWHVVRDLFERDAPDGLYRVKADAAGRLEVEFDDYLARVGTGATVRSVGPLRVRAHPDWCVVFSPAHQDESDDKLPADLADLDNHWDYAVIRLALAPGLVRRWAPDAPVAVPEPAEEVFIFQHPKGDPMRVGHGKIAAVDVTTRTAVPSFRFLHRANTEGGSSGGPCFDKRFEFFGLHQGVWPRGNAEAAKPVTNRGIPLVRVREHIKQVIKNLPVPDPADDPAWRLDVDGNFEPVLGCVDFQSAVWRSAVALGAGPPRLLVIDGAKGSGKTFRVRLLAAMLPTADHLRVELNAEALATMTLGELVEEISRQAGAPVPELRPQTDSRTTPAAWLKGEVCAKLMTALAAIRGDRRVWLVITELNKFEIKDRPVSELLWLLYGRARTEAWLRVVLDGMSGDVPNWLLDHGVWHTTTPIKRDEIETYFRRLAAEHDLPIDDLSIRVLGRTLWEKYNRALGNERERDEAVNLLIREVRTLTRAYRDEADPA